MTTLLEYAERADCCHTRLCELADNDRTKWTPQYQRMLKEHNYSLTAIEQVINDPPRPGWATNAELDRMFTNAYPESWVRDVILGQPPIRCRTMIGRGQCELEDGHSSHHVSGKWMKFVGGDAP